MRKIEVCLSPELLHLYDLKGMTVVVVDILRATSCMTAALANGVSEIVPVSELSECKKLKDNGYLTAAERNGEKVDGFDFGNSPYNYIDGDVSGRKLGITTTNGTLSINKSKNADQIVIGSFLNISRVVNYLKEGTNDVLILCAGWKGQVNLEDTMFSGAVVEALIDDFEVEFDSTIIARNVYNASKENKFEYLKNSSHFKRLSKMGIEKDIKYCMNEDVFDVLPVMDGDVLINKK